MFKAFCLFVLLVAYVSELPAWLFLLVLVSSIYITDFLIKTFDL